MSLPKEEPTTICVSLKWTNVNNIIASSQTFNADFVVLAEWKPGAKGKEWSPHLSVSNTLSLDVVFDTGNQTYSCDETSGEIRVRRIMRFRGELTADYPFHDFPFDIQELPITLRLGVPITDAVLKQGLRVYY